MSAIMEKTLSALPGLLTAAVTGRPEILQENRSQAAFHSFFKKCRDMRSKEEEHQFISGEIDKIKSNLNDPNIKSKSKSEFLVCLLYCHLIGHDVSFAHIHAIKLAQQGNYLQKRTGYLLCSIFMDESNDLLMLLVNTILKDLRSNNLLDICTALTSLRQLTRADMIPALLPAVLSRVQHQKDIVRKKSVLCLVKFYELSADCLEPHVKLFEQALSDTHPSIAWAATTYYLRLVETDVAAVKPLTGAFVNIHRQIVDQRFPQSYTFQGVAAPWLQIQLLKILSHLGKDDQGTSSQMYTLLNDILLRVEATTKTGLAVIYECLMTICVIYPNNELLDKAAKCVSRFLTASNLTIKYLGLKALCELVRINSRIALEHQPVIMESLSSVNVTLQNQAFELLFCMANPKNIVVISRKLLERLKLTKDENCRKGTVDKLVQLCLRFQQEFKWYVETMAEVVRNSSDFELNQNVISQFVTDILTANKDGKDCAANLFWSLLQKENVCDRLLQVSILVVCEFWRNLSEQGVSITDVVERIFHWFKHPHTVVNPTKRQEILLALQTLLLYLSPDEQKQHLQELATRLESSDVRDRQMLRELEGICNHSEVFKEVFNQDKSSKQFDFTLSFLDDYVVEGLEKGAYVYKPPSLRKHTQVTSAAEKTGLKFESYEATSYKLPEDTLRSENANTWMRNDNKETVEVNLKKSVWSLEGYKPDNTPASEASAQTTDIAQNSQEPSVERNRLEEELFAGVGEACADTRVSSVDNMREEKHHHEKSSSTLHAGEINRTLQSRETSDSVGKGTLLSGSNHDLSGAAIGSHLSDLNLTEMIEPRRHQYTNLDDYFETDSLEGSPSKH